MSRAARVEDPVSEAVSQILAEAASLRGSGSFSAERQAELDRCFDELAGDPAALWRAVDAGALRRPQAYRFTSAEAAEPGGPPPAGASRPARLVRSGSRRVVSAARRRVGPPARALERRAVDHVGKLAESLDTRRHVTADHARRLAGDGRAARLLERLSPGNRALPTHPLASRAPSSLLGALQPIGSAAALSEWAIQRLEHSPGPRVLHVRSGDGGLVARLAASGFDACGADPGAEPSSAVARAGALERLQSERCSLDGLVLSGVTDDVTPATARALAQLAARSLRPDGIVVLVSAQPFVVADEDVITSDLARARSLHPVTWCHLLARYGMGEITVADSTVWTGPDGVALYGVSARRRP